MNSNKSKVVVLQVPYGEIGGVQRTVKKAMELASWNDHVVGEEIVIKVNLISNQLVPGQCTSPWVLEGVIQQVFESIPGARLTICDSDLAAAQQCDEAFEMWGHKELAETYGARFVNLSKEAGVKIDVPNGLIFREMEVPRSIMNADCIITVPVLKTHVLSTITCALKHQWGIVNRTVRHQYHLVFDKAIADLNTVLRDKLRFAVVDGTIGMEGNGPRTGHPVICNLVIASPDLVACDAVAAALMGIPIEKVTHTKICAKRGIGSLEYELVSDFGNLKPVHSFALPDKKWAPIFFWELFLRQTPLKKLFFDTEVIFRFVSWIATQYNSILWFKLRGSKYAQEILNDPYYGSEFGRLANRAL